MQTVPPKRTTIDLTVGVATHLRQRYWEMREKDLTRRVRDMAEKYGWLHYSVPDSRYASSSGYPDMHLVGHGRQIFLEAKQQPFPHGFGGHARRRVYSTEAQLKWLVELNEVQVAAGYLFPSDLFALEAFLKGPDLDWELALQDRIFDPGHFGIIIRRKRGRT